MRIITVFREGSECAWHKHAWPRTNGDLGERVYPFASLALLRASDADEIACARAIAAFVSD